MAMGAASDAASSQRERRRIENQALVEAAKETPGFKKAAELRGDRLAVKEQLGLIIMRPLARIMGVSREYFDTNFGQDFAAKIADIPEENLQTPKGIIAGPVMEGLGYSLDEPNLKDMYLELLARASDDRAAAEAHPSFVEVIRQLSGEEAGLLGYVLKVADGRLPLVGVRLNLLPDGSQIGLKNGIVNLVDLSTGEPVVNHMMETYLDNWARLGLIELDYGMWLAASGSYDWAESRPEVEDARERGQKMQLRADQTSEVEIVKGTVRTTHFGARFRKAVGLER